MINCPLCNTPLITAQYKNYCPNISVPEDRPHYSVPSQSHFQDLHRLDVYIVTLYPFQVYYYQISTKDQFCDVHFIPKTHFSFEKIADHLPPIKFSTLPDFMNKLNTVKNLS